VDGTARHLSESERVRNRVEDMVAQRQADFDEQTEKNKQALDLLDADVLTLSDKLSNINNMVSVLK
jgi:predicted extracellular nuclease